VATTAVLSAKVAVVDSGEVRSAVYSRYNNGLSYWVIRLVARVSINI
jgi:hypothetical protein